MAKWKNQQRAELRIVPESCPPTAEVAPRTLRATTRVCYVSISQGRVYAEAGAVVDPCEEDRECMLAAGLAE